VATAEAPAPISSSETQSPRLNRRNTDITPLKKGKVASTRMACSMNTIMAGVMGSVPDGRRSPSMSGTRSTPSTAHMTPARAISTKPGTMFSRLEREFTTHLTLFMQYALRPIPATARQRGSKG
jgi:hypothetical protein